MSIFNRFLANHIQLPKTAAPHLLIALYLTLNKEAEWWAQLFASNGLSIDLLTSWASSIGIIQKTRGTVHWREKLENCENSRNFSRLKNQKLRFYGFLLWRRMQNLRSLLNWKYPKIYGNCTVQWCENCWYADIMSTDKMQNRQNVDRQNACDPMQAKH